jgi:ubiquinone biosynthesis protein UbiJ
MRNSASEYLRYETDYLVSGDNLETFIQAVDDLRDDVERLKIRLDRLHGRER